jgi:hypothetical protein
MNTTTPATAARSTVLKDKNGTALFEGDSTPPVILLSLRHKKTKHNSCRVMWGFGTSTVSPQRRRKMEALFPNIKPVESISAYCECGEECVTG